jgi:hypothetical protein
MGQVQSVVLDRPVPDWACCAHPGSLQTQAGAQAWLLLLVLLLVSFIFQYFVLLLVSSGG